MLEASQTNIQHGETKESEGSVSGVLSAKSTSF